MVNRAAARAAGRGSRRDATEERSPSGISRSRSAPADLDLAQLAQREGVEPNRDEAGDFHGHLLSLDDGNQRRVRAGGRRVNALIAATTCVWMERGWRPSGEQRGDRDGERPPDDRA